MKARKQLTRSDERMRTKIDWLDSRHSFSFGGQHDPERMGFGPLRVVNEDHVAPGDGFPPHPHRDMEIVSIVLEGELAHKDSLGNGRTVRAGEIQYMSAGTGVVHSESNPSSSEPVHFMQIWIEPLERGLTPRYADQSLGGAADNAWSLILSRDGRDGSMAIRQDAELRTTRLRPGAVLDYAASGPGRGFWIFAIDGTVEVAGECLDGGDSLALRDTGTVQFANPGDAPARVLLFDVPQDGAVVHRRPENRK